MSNLALGPVPEIALVNNMPDAALAATEAKFARLVRAGAKGRPIRWRRYTLPGHERSDKARRYLSRSHETIDALYRRGADGLIVTGCEPRAESLEQEPYWPHMQRLVDWARDNTRSTIWSCLAAHAAVWRVAGVPRRRSPRKISGVYRFHQSADLWSSERAGRLVPHSRYNGLDKETLIRRGFTVSGFREEIGVDMFWRREPSLFLFLQGHPEYDADTLAREYRRDIQRFLEGARADYPRQPENMFEPELSLRLEEMRGRIEGGDRSNASPILATLLSSQNYRAPWAADSVKLFSLWLRFVGNDESVGFAMN
jgi:homoserine O-succinyltransferase